MLAVAVNQAKNQLSALIHAAEGGEEVVLTRHGKPVVRMVSEPALNPQLSQDETARQALTKLHAFQALVRADKGYTKGDWAHYRDDGRM